MRDYHHTKFCSIENVLNCPGEIGLKHLCQMNCNFQFSMMTVVSGMQNIFHKIKQLFPMNYNFRLSAATVVSAVAQNEQFFQQNTQLLRINCNFRFSVATVVSGTQWAVESNYIPEIGNYHEQIAIFDFLPRQLSVALNGQLRTIIFNKLPAVNSPGGTQTR